MTPSCDLPVTGPTPVTGSWRGSPRHPAKGTQMRVRRGLVMMSVSALTGASLIGAGSPAQAIVPCNEAGDIYVGTARNDTLTGTSGNDVFLGYGGDDLIFGMGGTDTIFAGTGADTVYGG